MTKLVMAMVLMCGAIGCSGSAKSVAPLKLSKQDVNGGQINVGYNHIDLTWDHYNQGTAFDTCGVDYSVTLAFDIFRPDSGRTVRVDQIAANYYIINQYDGQSLPAGSYLFMGSGGESWDSHDESQHGSDHDGDGFLWQPNQWIDVDPVAQLTGQHLVGTATDGYPIISPDDWCSSEDQFSLIVP